MRSVAPRPASVWAPPARPRRARFRWPSLRVPLRGDVLLALLLVAASVLGTAWAATSAGSARVGIMLGVLAFVMVCMTLLVIGWSTLQARDLTGSSARGRLADGARQVEACGRWFAGWFAAQQLTWSALGLALAAGVLLPRGATDNLVLATVGGLLAVVVVGLAAALSATQPPLTGQAAALAACWRSPIPHGMTTHGMTMRSVRSLLARAVALLLLPTRLAQVRVWDAGQPQPFLRKIVQVSEDTRRGRAGYVLDVRPAAGISWRAELKQRAAVYATVWLFGALVALIALRSGLIAPIVPALTALTGAGPLTQEPEAQASPTPEADAGGGDGSGGGGGDQGGGQGSGSASGAGSAGQGDGGAQGDGSASSPGSAVDGPGNGQNTAGASGSGGGGGGAGQSQGADGQPGQQGQQGAQPGQQGQSGGQGQSSGQQQGSGQQEQGQQGQGQGQESGQQGQSSGAQNQQGAGGPSGEQQAGGQQGEGQQGQAQRGQGSEGQGEQPQAQAGGGPQPGESQGAGGGSGDQRGQRTESDDTQQGDSQGGSDRPGGGTGGPGATRGGDPSAPPTPPQLGAPTPVQPPSAQSTDDIVSIELPAIGPGQQTQGTPQPLPGTPLPAQPGQAGPQGTNASGTAAQGSRSAGQPLPPWIQSLLDGAGRP